MQNTYLVPSSVLGRERKKEAMEPLSAIGLASEVVQFIQFTESKCNIIDRFHKDNYENFKAGLFAESARRFLHFSSVFKFQLQNGLRPAPSQNAEVSKLRIRHVCTADHLQLSRRVD
jgi:hypothetical protein